MNKHFDMNDINRHCETCHIMNLLENIEYDIMTRDFSQNDLKFIEKSLLETKKILEEV